MAKYNAFAEKSGLQKVTEQKPLESILAIGALLSKLDLNLQLLRSERYISLKIDCLSSSEIDQLKQLLVKNRHPRFVKEFAVSRHQPFGKTSDYINCIKNGDTGEITKLVKLVGMLMQTKVYLFLGNQIGNKINCL
jgi:hypothetical protein